MYIYYGLSASEIVENIVGEEDYDEEDEFWFDEDDRCKIEELDHAEFGNELEDEVFVEKLQDRPKAQPAQALIPIAIAPIPTNVCSICFEEFDDDEMQGDMLIGAVNPTKVSMRGCNHPFCKECLHHYIKHKLGNAFCLYHSVRCSCQFLRCEELMRCCFFRANFFACRL